MYLIVCLLNNFLVLVNNVTKAWLGESEEKIAKANTEEYI